MNGLRNKERKMTNFIAPPPTKFHPYYLNFIEFMNSIEKGDLILDNWGMIEDVNDEISDKIISHLLELACQCQNIMNINIGRYHLQNSSKEWLVPRLRRLINSVLDEDDNYWAYIRTLELFSTIDESLTKEIANQAAQHEDVEIREICLLYTSPSPRDRTRSRMPSSA